MKDIIKKQKKIVFSVMCLLMMFAPMIGAAADGNESFTVNDFIKPGSAKQELEDSAFKNPVDRGTNWLTLAIVGVIILYFAGCLYKFKTGDEEERAAAFKGMFFGVVMIVAFMACTSTGLDALTWEY